MTGYVLRRVGQAAVVLWAAYTVTFVILYLLPSDPVAIQLSANNIEVDSLTPRTARGGGSATGPRPARLGAVPRHARGGAAR